MGTNIPPTSKRPSLTGNAPAAGSGERILSSLESGRSPQNSAPATSTHKPWLSLALGFCILAVIAVPAYILLSHKASPLPSPIKSVDAALVQNTNKEDVRPALTKPEKTESALILDELEGPVPAPVDGQVQSKTSDAIADALPPAAPASQPTPQSTTSTRQVTTTIIRKNTFRDRGTPAFRPRQPTAAQSDEPELLNSLINIINQRPEQTTAPSTGDIEQAETMDELIQQINSREQQDRLSNTRALERIRRVQPQAEKLGARAQEALEKSK